MRRSDVRMTRFIPGMERLVRVEQTGPWVPLGHKESLFGRQWQMPVTAFVGVDGVPQGWKVGLLDHPMFELGPNRRKRCRLQVEMMHALGYSADPLPFTVSARTPATDLPASRGGAPDRGQTTGYVQLKVARRTAEKLEAQQKWARRHHGVLALGPANGWKNQLLS
jgi:hypothetical protein